MKWANGFSCCGLNCGATYFQTGEKGGESMKANLLVLVVLLAGPMTAAVANDTCENLVAQIDLRLTNYEYEPAQVQQAAQMKQTLGFFCMQPDMPPQAVAEIEEQMQSAIDQILPLPAGDGPASTEIAKDRLTNGYLEGPWCRPGQEATSYKFAADGTYRIWVVGFGSMMADQVRNRSEFTDAFDYVSVQEDDRFVVVKDHRRRPSDLPALLETTYTRGECAFMSAPGYAG